MKNREVKENERLIVIKAHEADNNTEMKKMGEQVTNLIQVL